MNTLLLTVDALRADHIGQHGYHRDTLPVVDDLTTEGVCFSQAFSNGTTTIESVPSLFTSSNSSDKSVEDGPTISSVLRETGVTTGGVHSNAYFAHHFSSIAGMGYYEDFGLLEDEEMEETETPGTLPRRTYSRLKRLYKDRIGTGEFIKKLHKSLVPPEFSFELPSLDLYVRAEDVTDEVGDWIRRQGNNEFFLWVHYIDPHMPYGVSLSDPAYVQDSPSTRVIEKHLGKAKYDPESLSDSERQLLIDLYDSEIAYTSRQIERLIEVLRNCGIYEETNVILSADHGEEFGDHGGYFHRNRPYDELLHVPLAVKPADEVDAFEGVDTGKTVQLIDIAPTICALHGINIPEAFEGEPLFAGGDRDVVATATGRQEDTPPVTGVRAEGWKYIHIQDQPDELYCLSDDPREQNSVIARNSDIANELRSVIPEDLTFQSTTIDAEDIVEERLRGLGYVD